MRPRFIDILFSGTMNEGWFTILRKAAEMVSPREKLRHGASATFYAEQNPPTPDHGGRYVRYARVMEASSVRRR